MFHNVIYIYTRIYIYVIDLRHVNCFSGYRSIFFCRYSFSSFLSASSFFYYLVPGLHGAFEIPNYR